MPQYDAVVVGAGPNGLAAAAHLSRNGKKVLVVERGEVVGGGTRTEELTLPGFLHDVCSAIHPMGVASPFFNEIGLDVEWVHSPIPVSHPLEGGRPAGLTRSLAETESRFGSDGGRYRKLIGPLVKKADLLIEDFLGPLSTFPRNPATFVRMAARGALPATTIINRFENDEPRAVLAGMAAHAIAPFSSALTGGVALLFTVIAHAYGWPMSLGGSQRIAEALASIVLAGGGVIQTGQHVASLAQLPESEIVLLDVMPGAAAAIGGDRVWPGHRRGFSKSGPGVFKVDWALTQPIPWIDELSPLSATVHLGGTYEEILAAEDMVHSGEHPNRPFVLLAQQTPFDPTRAPNDGHTAWAYCHVPAGSTKDMTDAIEMQVERFAPGFRDLIIGRHTMDSVALQTHNPNYAGGDITGGGFGMKKVLQIGAANPYRIGDRLYLCSSSTPPGAGVHGMCGFFAAKAALSA